MKHLIRKLCVLVSLAAATAAPAATNIIPTGTQSVTVNCCHGILRAGSPWGPGSTPSNIAAVTDGIFAPEGQQWNNGSFWWDEDSSVNSAKVFYTIQLNHMYEINRFVVQADDNEEYVVDYWNGTAFVALEDIPGVGLQTRDSGILASSITTDQLRLSARGGDKYYSISEFQAFGTAVPEPATWAMMMIGFGLVGSALRRRRGTRQVAFS